MAFGDRVMRRFGEHRFRAWQREARISVDRRTSRRGDVRDASGLLLFWNWSFSSRACGWRFEALHVGRRGAVAIRRHER